MKLRKHKPLLEKSVHAALSAIEIYNKPDFKYREETFSILMVNAWELLLKSRLIKENNSIDIIYEFEVKAGIGGSVKNIVKRNRSGYAMTISLSKCLDRCTQTATIKLNSACHDNIVVLIEIRDASIHFYNKDKHLSKKIFEVGTASLQNYVAVIREWFDYDLSKYNFYLMPLSFFHDFESVKSLSISSKNKQVQKLLTYISNYEKRNVFDVDSNYSVSTEVKTKFVKSRSNDGDAIAFSFKSDKTDKNVIEVILSEQQIMEKFPLTFNDLCCKLKNRYSDFKQGGVFNTLKSSLEVNNNLAYCRLLNPKNPKGGKKTLYSHSIVSEFDKHYTKKL